MNGLSWAQSTDEQATKHDDIVHERGQVHEAQRRSHLERHKHVHRNYQSWEHLCARDEKAV